MYRKSVVHCNKVKYNKTSADVLQKVFSADLSYISSGGEEWICKTCDRSLSRGYMPVQAKANGLQLCEVPPELSDLNPLELRLICLRLPFLVNNAQYMGQLLMCLRKLTPFVMSFHVCPVKPNWFQLN